MERIEKKNHVQRFKKKLERDSETLSNKPWVNESQCEWSELQTEKNCMIS